MQDRGSCLRCHWQSRELWVVRLTRREQRESCDTAKLYDEDDSVFQRTSKLVTLT